MRLIDAGQIVYSWFVEEDGTMSDGITLQSIINRLPTIVEFEGDINKVIVKGEEYHRIVRCKDCKWSYDDVCGRICSHGVCVDCVVSDGFYCADAERRSDE